MTYSVAGIPGAHRQGWVDALRVLACFMVVFSHCCDGFVAEFDNNHTAFLTGTLLGSLMRPCVPLFAMMTGVLLLPMPSDMTVAGFYRKRLGRILPPLIFWSLALPVMAYIYFSGAPTANPSVDMNAYTPDGLGNRLWTWIFNFNFDTTPLWYLYMLAGLYLIIPVVSGWLRTASKRDVEIVLAVWFFTLFLPYIKLFAPLMGYLGNYGHTGLHGECDWNAYGTFHYVSGFIGYIILAWYLRHYPVKMSGRKLAAVMVPMFVAGYALTAGLYLWFQTKYPGDYAFLEIAWMFTGINVFMMTVPVFVAVQRSGVRTGRLLSYVASLTFGIYLCHFFFVMVGYDIYNIPGLPYWTRIIATAVTVFVVSAALTALMGLTRFTARFIK